MSNDTQDQMERLHKEENEMVEMYVTATDTIYPENGDVEVHLWGRDLDGNPDHIIIEGFEPYFYVPSDEAGTLKPRDHSDLKAVEETEIPSLFDDDLTKLIATYPGGVRKLKDQYEKTFEADVDFTNRLRIDTEVYTGIRAPRKRCTADEVEPIEITDAPIRMVYCDIEIDDRGTIPVQGDTVVHTDSPVVSITAYDTFDQEYVGFISLNGRDITDALPGVVETGEPPGCLNKLKYYPDEKSLLKEYFTWISEKNPDMLLAWNVSFDASYLIERANTLGVDPSVMSRGPKPSATHDQYGTEVVGRVVYDLMAAWEAMQFSEVSSSLENAASMELGEDVGKIEHEDSIYEMWMDDPAALMEYNAMDVKLMVDINDAAGVMQDRKELKDAVGADFEYTIEANDFIEMLVRRMLHDWGVAGPTKTPPSGGSDDDDYEGAYTFPAFSGRRRNVTSIDVASLYPFTMWMLNASPETLIDTFDHPKDVAQRRDDVTAAPNGAVFDRSVTGLFRELVDKALELTRQAGRRRDNHDPDTEEWAYWNQVREARKRIRNAIYGVLGWVWFFLYDEPTAEAVTTMAQVVIKESAKYINEETVGEVIYGDTDSCYISWPDEWTTEEALEATHDVVTHLNQVVYPELATEWGIPADECKWEIEMEDASSVMFQAGKKKRYAKNVVWKEGMDFSDTLDENEIKIVGFEYKRSDSAALTKDLQKNVLTDIVTDADEETIRERVFEASQKIERRFPDWDEIGIPGGIRKALDEYESDTAQVRASKVSNKLLNTGIAEGDKPKRVYLESKTLENRGESERTDVVAFENGTDLKPIEDQLYVDTKKMRDTIIKGPIERILDPLGIDTEAAMNGQTQNSIADWV